MSGGTGIEAAIDRIEDGIAVVAIRGGGELTIDANLLPDGAREGVAIRIHLEVDLERTDALRTTVEDLQRRLREGGE